MASSKLLLFHMLLALTILAGGSVTAAPMVHFININSAPIDLHIKAGGLSSSVQVTPGQDYGMRVQLDNVYFVLGISGTKFTSFRAYEPSRDKAGRMFWRANRDGFAMSHDKVHWQLMARWESE